MNLTTFYLKILDYVWEEWGSWTDCWKHKGSQTIHNGLGCQRKRTKSCNIAKSKEFFQKSQVDTNDSEQCNK